MHEILGKRLDLVRNLTSQFPRTQGDMLFFIVRQEVQNKQILKLQCFQSEKGLTSSYLSSWNKHIFCILG